MLTPTGLLLEFSDGRPSVTGLAEVNQGLAPFGSLVIALDLADVPEDVRRLLAQPRLSAADAEHVKARFLARRQRLLQIVAEAGRTPTCLVAVR